MPSFLSKVFGSSKSKKHSPTDTNPQPLGGKFEAVSPTISPSAEKFSDTTKSKNKDKDNSGFNTIFRSKSRPNLPSSPSASSPSLKVEEPPHLSLRLDTEAAGRPGVKDVFAEDVLLSESAIMEKRLSPEEVTQLVKACKEAIFARGLETLGVMHPHWHSASTELQQRLISLFLRSLASTSTSPAATRFTNELQEARDPHDVAAVLRWALRHLQLPSSSSSTSNTKLESKFGMATDWYPTFSAAEVSQNYPAKAYTSILAPLLPEANVRLLGEVLEIVSALAPLAEKNSTSTARLSMIFGLWLLAEDPRVRKGESWKEFYERWEVMGRILEHLFLVRVREEAASNRLPTRLLELVKSYPFGTSPSPEGLLPRTRFSTRRHHTLFVRIETEVSSRYKEIHGKKRLGPRVLVSRALAAQVIPGEGEGDDSERALWSVLKDCKKTEEGEEDLGSVFADETLRLFELVEQPRGRKGREGQVSPTFSVFPPPSSTRSPAVRSHSERDTIISSASPSSNGHSKYATDSALQTPTISPTTAASSIIVDWAQFSTAGFGDVSTQNRLAETLWDEEIEKTVPKVGEPGSVVSRIRNRSRSRSRPRTKGSIEVPREERVEKEDEEEKFKSRVVQVSSVLLDEAFVDFWSDTLTDSVVTREWPEFIVCKLKSTVSPTEKKAADYLVLEHTYTVPPPPPPPPAEAAPRASSPRPSLKDKKRFSFFSSSTSGRPSIGGRGHSGSVSSTRNRFAGGGKAKVGEMGEVLKESEEEKLATVKVKVPIPKGRKSLAKEEAEKKEKEAENGNVAGVSAGAVTGAASAAPVSEPAPTPLAKVKPVEEDLTPKAEDKFAPAADVSVPDTVTEARPEETVAHVLEPVVENVEESAVVKDLVVEQPAAVEEPVTPVPVPEEPTEQHAEAPVESASVKATPAPVEEVAPAATEIVGTIPAELTPTLTIAVQPEETAAVAPEPAIENAEESVIAEVPAAEQPAAVEEPETPAASEPAEQPAEDVKTEALPEVAPTEAVPAPIEEVNAPVEDVKVEEPVVEESAPTPSEPVAVAPNAEKQPPVIEEPTVEEQDAPVDTKPEATAAHEGVVPTETPVAEEEAKEETSAVTEPAIQTAEEVTTEAPAITEPATETPAETEVQTATTEDKPDEPQPTEPTVAEQSSSADEAPADVAAEAVEPSEPAVEHEPSATTTDGPASEIPQESNAFEIPKIVAKVDVRPPTGDPTTSFTIDVVRPTPTPSITGEDKTETTARAPGPEPIVEQVPLAEEAPVEEPKAVVESANGTDVAERGASDESEATPEALAEEAASPVVEITEPTAAGETQEPTEPTVNAEEVADESAGNGNAKVEEDVPEIPVEAPATPDAVAPATEATEIDTSEPAENTENIISATPRIEPLPVDAENKVEEALVDLPAVPLVEATIPPSNAPEDTYVSVPVTEPDVPASSEQVDATPAPNEETANPEVAASKEEVLPAAPESVVLAGSTPGPTLALSTSEPAAVEAATKDDAEIEFSEVPSEHTNGKHIEEANDTDAPPNGSNHKQETVESTNADKD
ncbi:hypothetical protein BDQ17DRAFT_262797 [Cyathus striatus]|nr:hypothetical protein BDQ17DRAFT_262797 [Cyathus striatus]